MYLDYLYKPRLVPETCRGLFHQYFKKNKNKMDKKFSLNQYIGTKKIACFVLNCDQLYFYF